ncbi:hypothetical protein PABG_04018 [Paracoccidioides brasiliensis Pb03]|uniref:Hydrophobin n=3 Tax=Paracoccidioides TaxID=38946 RepID=C1GJN6_PARBD|nr:hydrophobin [Paracoccidioides lutzii Pb01]XP_010762860.1 uncharacterized protein PADG_07472 [Paracoccidioides brasiliensis Pb18]AAR11449.1 hydrophobin 2 [Paracoccidioides brasiliensis]EEH21802.1 hypothetical protein PABG_04018 [Paracoccidioides brasiliensis Pb03]EEH33182.2 hydrophobin [Paracoccidioides lutzii Pb01]EEH42652.1 hypothetical protein PADG_07472 [Paracoccidioides brasiliensis Pb18]ODH41603.1 hypothetical protein ACO22_01371 [Paracoccidioides brasiliensis]
MKFSLTAVVLALATAAVAAPGGNYKGAGPREEGPSISRQCGQAQISCCNKQISTVNGGDKNSGLLNGVLGTVIGKGGSVGIFDQCSKLSLSALIGVTDNLNSQCKQTVACCQGDSKAEGLVALNLPCIPIAAL